MGVIAGIDKGLQSIGIDICDQKSKLVSCNFDGASVINIGKHNGVAKNYSSGSGDHLIKVHFVAHNLELAAVDVLEMEKKQAMAEVETTLKGVSVSSKPKSATWPDRHSKMC